MPVKKARWWRRYPKWAATVALVSAILVAGATVMVVSAATAPKIDCGDGMVPGRTEAACVGVDLTGAPISPNQPGPLTQLQDELKAANAAVAEDNYVSIVLLLDLSPEANVDTASHENIFAAIEGAITAAWQANHTAVYDGTPQAGATPQAGVKLFLGNMGSKNADWESAVTQIGTAAVAHHITSVTGLGQSTAATREAVTKLTTLYHLPVIGSTITGDTMNADPRTSALLDGFFRVAPTNAGLVVAAEDYIQHHLHVAADRVAIVEDSVRGDDYIETLVEDAHKTLAAAHRFPFTSPPNEGPSQARDLTLKGQFGYLNVNLCQAHPDVVYFAGRGVDIGAFLASWTDGDTECSQRPLTVLTGDDGVEAIANDMVAHAVATGHIEVEYTAVASPGKWGACPDDVVAQRAAFDQFRAAFTGRPSCDSAVPAPADHSRPPGYDAKDLASGVAMVNHDAVGLAATVARRAGNSASANPWSQIGVLQEIRCNGAFRGATGEIAFSPDTQYHGNPIGMTLPIIAVRPDKTAATVSTGWSTGGPAPDAGC